MSAGQRWLAEDGASLGASIAFYAMFALAPMLVLAITAAGLVFGAEAVRGQIFAQIQGVVGPDAAQTIEAMIRSANVHHGGVLASVLGSLTLIVGATGVFMALRRALNAIGGVQPLPSAMSALLRARLMGLALVLGMGFLSIVSLVLSAALSAMGEFVARTGQALQAVLTVLDVGVSTVLLAIAFAALLRWLPDTPPPRRGIWVGSLCSALLFAIGKHLIGLYLGTTGVSSSYGAAGSFVMVMLWVYYSAQILLFGGALAFALRKDPPEAGLDGSR